MSDILIPPAIPPLIDHQRSFQPHGKPAVFLVPTGRRNGAMALLALCGLFDLLAAGPAIATLMLIGRVRAGEQPDRGVGTMIDLVAGLISLGAIAIYLATVVVFSCWFYRVVANSRMLTSERGTSPGMAVGSFFIPILCLFYPYMSARIAWRTSAWAVNPGVRPRTGLINAWWFVWIVGNMVGFLAMRLSLLSNSGPGALSLGQIEFSQYASLTMNVIGAASAVLCLLVVNRLTAMQAQVAKSWSQPPG